MGSLFSWVAGKDSASDDGSNNDQQNDQNYDSNTGSKANSNIGSNKQPAKQQDDTASSALDKDPDRLRQEQEAEEALKKIQEQEAALAAALKAEEERKAAEAAAEKKRQEEEAARKAAELAELERKAAEEKARQDAIALAITNRKKASQLVMAILYNYQFGNVEDIEKDYETNWVKNVNSVVNTCLNETTYNLLFRLPYFTQLLYPTGLNETSFHEYKLLDAVGTVDIPDFEEKYYKLLPDYIAKVVPSYVTNIIQANCVSPLTTDPTDDQTKIHIVNKTAIHNAFNEHYTKESNFESDTVWFNSIIDMLRFDYHIQDRCSMLYAKSGKGLSKKAVRLVPSFYPKLCPIYECFKAMICLSNTVFNHYGVLLKNTNSQRYGSAEGCENRKTESNNGGMCFNFGEVMGVLAEGDNSGKIKPNDFVTDAMIIEARQYEKIKFIPFNERLVELDVSKLGQNNNDFDDNFTLVEYDVVHKYAANADGSGGFMKYMNPTQHLTSPFINDFDTVTVKFEMPRIGAKYIGADLMLEVFREYYLNDTYSIFNVTKITNYGIMNWAMYLSYMPEGMFVGDEFTTPLARFVYEVFVNRSSTWTLSIGIDNTMTCSRMNTVLEANSNTNKLLPQIVFMNNPPSDRTMKATVADYDRVAVDYQSYYGCKGLSKVTWSTSTK